MYQVIWSETLDLTSDKSIQRHAICDLENAWHLWYYLKVKLNFDLVKVFNVSTHVWCDPEKGLDGMK